MKNAVSDTTKKSVGSAGNGRFFTFRSILLLLLLLILLLLPSFTGCDSPEPPMTEYLSSPLDAEVTVTANGITYRATLHLGADRDGERESETVLLSPSSLAGLTVREKDGTAVLTLGEMTVPYGDGGGRGFLLAASLFSPGTVVGRETGQENGATCLLLRFADGRTVSVDPASGDLLAIRSGDVTLTVTWCEIREGAE